MDKRDWICPKCNINIFGNKNLCLKCNNKRPDMGLNGGRTHDRDWLCTKCKVVIFGSKSSCYTCGEKRPLYNV